MCDVPLCHQQSVESDILKNLKLVMCKIDIKLCINTLVSACINNNCNWLLLKTMITILQVSCL